MQAVSTICSAIWILNGGVNAGGSVPGARGVSEGRGRGDDDWSTSAADCVGGRSTRRSPRTRASDNMLGPSAP
jgi:hypothetical protein